MATHTVSWIPRSLRLPIALTTAWLGAALPASAQPAAVDQHSEHVLADTSDALDVRDALRAATERFGGFDVLAIDVDALGGEARELVSQAIAFLAAQGTGGAIVLVARNSDVTELCRTAGREAAPSRVYVNAVVLGPVGPVGPGAPVWQQAARAALLLAERSAASFGQLIRIDGEP